MSMESILPVARAFENYRHHYDNGGANYSVSETIQPPRMTILQKRHYQKILAEPLSVAKLMDAFDGTSKHMLFEKLLKDDPDFICEERLFTEIDGIKISGCPDLIYMQPDEVLYDYKNCKVWKRIFGDIEHWEQQLNIYSALINEKHDIYIKRISVIAWFKDFLDENKGGSKNYPQFPIEEMQIPLWSLDRSWSFLEERVGMLLKAEPLSDEDLPECTPEEMWERGSGWAAMPYKLKPRKRGFKAGRVLATRDLIEKWIEVNDPPSGYEWVIEERKGMRQRCEKYCDVAPYCSQWKEFKSGKRT